MDVKVIIETTELANIIRAELEAALSEREANRKSLSGEETTVLTRTEIARLFHVTLPTIHAWMNAGILPFHRMGGRVYFKKAEVLKAMKEAKVRRLS